MCKFVPSCGMLLFFFTERARVLLYTVETASILLFFFLAEIRK